jgi:hypothetical protein
LKYYEVCCCEVNCKEYYSSDILKKHLPSEIFKKIPPSQIEIHKIISFPGDEILEGEATIDVKFY